MEAHKEVARRVISGILLGTAVLGPAHSGEIYRWNDAAGTVHYGDQPVPGAERVELAPSARAVYEVSRVLDGDTIELANGTRVRFIGLNAPEIAHRSDPAESGGRAAHRYLRSLLEDRRVRIVPGEERTDRYNRLLAHVFTESGLNIGLKMLQRGHAHATIHPPNLRHAADYFGAERSARRSRRGLWRLEPYTIQPASRAAALRNRFSRIRGRVTAITTKRKYTYIDFGDNLTAAVANGRLKEFARHGKAIPQLEGQTIILRGWVRKRDEHPFLRLRHPLQLE